MATPTLNLILPTGPIHPGDVVDVRVETDPDSFVINLHAVVADLGGEQATADGQLTVLSPHTRSLTADGGATTSEDAGDPALFHVAVPA